MNEFNPLHYPSLYLSPQLVSIESSWVQLIPVAYAMIELTRPGTFVELGTHHGDSYCAFCQAVVETKSPTRCYAVDTWRGDDQAGFYGPEVLATLKAHHDPQFASFSTLMQTDFDSAAKQFADGQIDLLHVDGHHTYESVKRDYETWLPKLSDRGVMMLHDANARHRPEFGVWKLWEEVSKDRPSFMFPYSYGLGIVAVEARPPEALLQFLQQANANPPQITRFFAEMGQRVLAVQVMLKLSRQLLGNWDLLSQWRQHIGQAPLQQLTLEQVFISPDQLARVIGEETKRLAEEDIAFRKHHSH